MRYGFIGLGNLGGKLAASLVRGGFDVTVCDRDPEAVARLVALGATAAATPREAVTGADAAITCMPSPKVSMAVLSGPDGVLAGLGQGGTWIEMSTNDQQESALLAAHAEAHGVTMLEAPVTGGVHLAASGEITVLIGGDEAVQVFRWECGIFGFDGKGWPLLGRPKRGHDVAGDLQGMTVVVGKVVGDSADPRMDIGAAEILGADLFAGGRLHEGRATEEDGSLTLDDDGLVANRGNIRAARRA